MTARRPATPRPGAGRSATGRAGGAAAAPRTPATGVGRGAGRAPASRGGGTAPSSAPSAARAATRAATRPPPRARPVVRPTTMLAGVLVVLALTVVPMLRPWIAQRQELAAQQQTVYDLRRSVTELTAERNRWKDPAYVRAQAGERLNFVMPGQIRYTLLDDKGVTTIDRDPRTSSDAGTDEVAAPWYAEIWESARTAGREDG